MKAEATLSIDLVFKSPLPATINVLVYAEYDNVIEIDSNQRLEQPLMNTIQLDQFFTKDPFAKGSVAGVYGCDQLSSIEINEYPQSFMAMDLLGTYWIAIYFNQQMK